jgi:hypothetical protein
MINKQLEENWIYVTGKENNILILIHSTYNVQNIPHYYSECFGISCRKFYQCCHRIHVLLIPKLSSFPARNVWSQCDHTVNTTRTFINLVHGQVTRISGPRRKFSDSLDPRARDHPPVSETLTVYAGLTSSCTAIQDWLTALWNEWENRSGYDGRLI